MSLIVSQRGPPRRYLTFAYGMWTFSTVAFIGYAFGTALWQFMAFAVIFGALETAGMVVWGTLMSSRVPPDLRGRVHSLDWFVSIGLTPLSFALTGPVSKGIGVDTTLVLAGVLPMVVCVVLYFAANLRRDEELHPLLGDYAGAGSSSAAGSETPAIW
jgi:DHA3 family tetracycline resistance protein-like MFS transporter